MNPTVWVCAVRREVFVGGESQRCRHWPFLGADGVETRSCGEMELIGGEPVEWCVVHGSNAPRQGAQSCVYALNSEHRPMSCQFESQVRVGP